MSTNLNRALALIGRAEGNFSKDRRDKGNWTGGQIGVGVLKGTKFGISAKAYPHLDIENLTIEQAHGIYFSDYWTPIRGDDLPWRWALLAFDCAVNQGVPTAIRLAQDACGVMVDGQIGPRTVGAMQQDNDRHLARFMVARLERYMKDSTWDVHGVGWMQRLFVMALNAR